MFVAISTRAYPPEVVPEHCEAAVREAQQADYGRRDEHVCVEAQPREVQSELDAEVFLHLVYWLVHDPLAHLRPLRVQQVSETSRRLVVTLYTHFTIGQKLIGILNYVVGVDGKESFYLGQEILNL